MSQSHHSLVRRALALAALLSLIAAVSFFNSGPLSAARGWLAAPADHAPPLQAATAPGCQVQAINLSTQGANATFQNPPTISSTGGLLSTTLVVTYGTNTIGTCQVYLRNYNGKLVGPTFRVRPGDTIRVNLVNQLPDDSHTDPHVNNTLSGFNNTNLHTHGLHVSPAGNSDNVLLDIAPGETFEYEIKIPLNHTPGTYWYHAHMHGSTATQVSSGMSGAIIITGDALPNNVDSQPEVKAAKEQIFVLQQVVYDEFGQLEPDLTITQTFPSLASDPNFGGYFGPCNWEPTQREHTINGQLFPVLTMTPNEVQRWRFIHSGIRESIGLELHGPYTGTNPSPTITDVLKLPTQTLNEIAVDGIALNKVDAWQQIELEPGYRSDALVQLKAGTYFLVDNGVKTTIVTQNADGTSTATTQTSDALTCSSDPEQPSFLATIKVTGTAKSMKLPTTAQLAKLPLPYPNIITVPTTITSGTQYTSENFINIVPGVVINNFQKVDFSVAVHGGALGFTAADHSFDPQNPRRLQLGNTDVWVLSTQEDSLYYAHPFHIHINPFQTWRFGPDGNPETVWRDTLLARQGVTSYAYTRYQDYIGQFVYHCHILDHEDQGMMELVEIMP